MWEIHNGGNMINWLMKKSQEFILLFLNKTNFKYSYNQMGEGKFFME